MSDGPELAPDGNAIIWPMNAYREELKRVGISVEEIPENMLDLLRQDEWWRPLNSEPIRVVDMSARHRRNLIKFLEVRAFRLHFLESFRNILIMSSPIGPSGEMACDSVDQMMAKHDATPPSEWLESLPLMKKLRELDPPDNSGPLDLDWDTYYS